MNEQRKDMNDETDPAGTADASHASDGQSDGQLRVIEVDAILQGERAVWIRFNDMTYRLQITSNGKLILTK